MTAPLSESARAIVAEEETLLERALRTLRARTHRARDDRSSLVEHLRSLQDDASTAAAKDLPHLFHQMTSVRALLEREEAKPEPDENTPYFAHLRLRTATGPRDYLLGRGTFADTSADVRIVDWRHAPIARIFYGYQEGDEFEEMLPGGLVEGTVETRRVLVIERGVLTRIVAGPMVLVRREQGWEERGSTALGGGAGTAARGGLGVGADTTSRSGKIEVTSLLDPEQFEAISQSGDRPLLVLGSAGSGKTTVALHRLARLAFDDPNRFAREKLRVVVPEEGLARLSRRLLEPLGLGSVRVDTLDRWLYRLACDVFGQKEIRLSEDPPSVVTRLKRHPALKRVLKKRIRSDHAHANYKTLRRRLLETFTDRDLLAQVVRAAPNDLSEANLDEIARYTMLQLAVPFEKQLEGYDADALTTVDGLSVTAGTPDVLAGTIDAEDLPLLLFMKAEAGGLKAEKLAHAVLDEAEDFSVFDMSVLAHQLGDEPSCTLAGDEMQQTHTSFPGWPGLLETLGAPDARTVRLQVSYRCPKPIADLAQKILGTQAPSDAARPGREGVPVGEHQFPDEAQAHLFIADAVRQLMDNEPDASVGLIASDPAGARRLHRAFSGMPGVRLVLDGRYSFEPGVDITDVDGVKGLEFDYVILPDATASAYPDTPEARRKLHVAVTRASHQLWVVSPGRPTPLV